MGLKGSGTTFKTIFTVVIALLLISLLAACVPSAQNNQTPASGVPANTAGGAGKPQGELVAALQGFGNENFLPWLDPVFSHCQLLVYDMLIYWDFENFKFLPGLAESWEVSKDGMTTTFHLRKGVQFSDGYGEFTAEDVKYTFEMQASPKSIGKVDQTRRIASMDIPDPYTLVVHMKDPYYTFYVDMSMGNSGVCQGIVCKKYVEKVGDNVAGQKPVGTGPYKLVESHPGDYYKFEALDSHWRVVPEFKNLTVRLIPEAGTLTAALKTKEVDLSQIPAEQLADLKAAGVAVEVNPVGGSILMVAMGGMVIPEDKRYDPAYHNKDPWTDPRVRKAMALAIDRKGIIKAFLGGFGDPAGVPLITNGIEKYQYPYDPAAAKQLLKEAGYPNGFSFRVIDSVLPSFQGAPQICEALAGYWKDIGLDPRLTVIDYNTYYSNNINKCKTAGDVWLNPINSIADQLAKAELFFIPNVAHVTFQDAGSYALYRDNPKGTLEERSAMVDRLNKYYYDNVGPIPIFRNAYNYAWNGTKILTFPHDQAARPLYLEYVRHNPSLNTFSLFRPWPSR